MLVEAAWLEDGGCRPGAWGAEEETKPPSGSVRDVGSIQNPALLWELLLAEETQEQGLPSEQDKFRPREDATDCWWGVEC